MLACTVCATPCGVAVGDEVVAEAPVVNSSLALVASALLPGAGHFLLGRRGAGIVRALTFALWVSGGAVLLRGALGSDQPILPAVPLLIGALVVWGTSAYDAVVIAEDRGSEVLSPRTFFWLVIAVVGTLMLSFVVSLSRLQPGSGSPTGGDVEVQVTGQ